MACPLLLHDGTSLLARSCAASRYAASTHTRTHNQTSVHLPQNAPFSSQISHDAPPRLQDPTNMTSRREKKVPLLPLPHVVSSAGPGPSITLFLKLKFGAALPLASSACLCCLDVQAALQPSIHPSIQHQARQETSCSSRRGTSTAIPSWRCLSVVLIRLHP
ncbi:hypothetical protein LX36DRAFT_427681 [Colletotrichum falcatum]|nr:hypothetical protein LX36DRAFT_427681 [Colletotrichum falcatum]